MIADSGAEEEADRASRELSRQVERARRRLLRRYRDILRERPSRDDPRATAFTP